MSEPLPPRAVRLPPGAARVVTVHVQIEQAPYRMERFVVRDGTHVITADGRAGEWEWIKSFGSFAPLDRADVERRIAEELTWGRAVRVTVRNEQGDVLAVHDWT